MAGDRPGRSLRISELRADAARFSFSWPPSSERGETLLGRIARFGLLRPLLCLPATDGHRVVSGSRRLAAVTAMGGDEVPVQFVEGLAGPELWDLLLEDHLDARPLNPVELGLYVGKRLADAGETPEELAARVLPRLGLPPRPSAWEDAAWVAELPERHRDAFADGRLPVQGARTLARADREDALAFLDLLGGVQTGVNKFGELATWILECAWRDGLAVRPWLERERLVAGPGAIDALRARVRQLRYPELARWEESFPADARRAGLPPEARLAHPRGFEGGGLTCTVRFESLPQLERTLVRVLERLRAGDLDALARYLG